MGPFALGELDLDFTTPSYGNLLFFVGDVITDYCGGMNEHGAHCDRKTFGRCRLGQNHLASIDMIVIF